jgi:pheromone shutdown-related protein TraB
MQNNIILVGTGHILEKSVKEVEEVIDREEPDVVAVELCEGRFRALKGDVEDFSIKDVISGGSPFLLLTHWLLAYVQRKMGAELGIEPGADMMAAIKKAEERGCEIALIDRPIQVTMQRFWSAMKGIEIGKGEEKNYIELDRITDDDVVTQLMGELREFSPGAATALLDERDAYIAGNLRELELHAISKEGTSADVDAKEEEEGRKIVAVVGAGHVAGIKNLLGHPELIPPKEELISLPKKRLFGIKNLLGVGLGAALLIILLAVIFSGISFQDLLRVSPYWIVINGVLSAAGVVIARGHPLSALTAFCASPITSLIPFLAAGWFAGLAEVHFRKPTVEDAKSMLNVESLRELMRNKLFKVILVAALANIGSMLGFWIGGSVVLHELGISVQDIWMGLNAFF